MAIPLLSNNPLVRRLELAKQYKAIEGGALSSLFPGNSDYRKWSKMQVLREVHFGYNGLTVEVRKKAVDDLEQAVGLREQAMLLWPTGTAAQKSHDEWINILERIVRLLKTSTQPHASVIRSNIVNATPQNIMKDKKAWSDVDLDLYLLQMDHWRKTMINLWDAAIADASRMSAVDISTGCAVRYFKDEMNTNFWHNTKWYGSHGSYSQDTLDYMKQTGPGHTGYEIWKISDSLKRKTVAEIERELKVAEIPNYPQELPTWLFADKAQHIDPLVDWVKDTIRRTAKRRNTFTHHEFLTAWLLYTDSRLKVWAHRMTLKEAALDRLNKVFHYSTVWDFVLGTEDARPTKTRFGARISALSKYASTVESVSGFAVVHCWADYAKVMSNVGLCLFPLIRATVLLFDVNCIMRRWQGRPVAVKVEQFCNKFQSFIYPTLGRRPATEAEWKAEARAWKFEDEGGLGVAYWIDRFSDYTVVDKMGKGWVRLAVIEDSLELKRSDFEISEGTSATKGTTQWWEAIQAQAQSHLLTPSLAPMYEKIANRYDIDGMRKVIAHLIDISWMGDRLGVEILLNRFEPSLDWFEGIVD